MQKTLPLFLILVVGMLGLVACGQVPGQQTGQGPVASPTLGLSPVPAIPLAPMIAPPSGEVVLRDEFATLGQTWAVNDTEQSPGEQAYWYAENGVLVQGGTTMDRTDVTPAYLAVTGGADWADYTVQVNIYVDTNDEVGLIFRVSDAGFYRFRMRSSAFEGPYQVGLDRYQDRRYSVLWHAPGNGFPVRQWFTVQIAVQGDTFAVSVDGNPLVKVQDATFSKGGIGFYAWAEGGAYFDNLVVTR